MPNTGETKNEVPLIGKTKTEVSQNKNEKIEKPKEKILIIGSGIAGITSAYFLARKGKYDITVIDKDDPIKGTTEQNANTVAFIPYPSWTTINYWSVIKESVFKSEYPAASFKFSLIFDGDFRFWCLQYFKNRSKKRVEQSNSALANLISYSISIYDEYINDVTENDPDKVEYHEETLTAVYKNLSAKSIEEKEELLKEIQKYQDNCRIVPAEKYGNEIE